MIKTRKITNNVTFLLDRIYKIDIKILSHKSVSFVMQLTKEFLLFPRSFGKGQLLILNRFNCFCLHYTQIYSLLDVIGFIKQRHIIVERATKNLMATKKMIM